MEANLFETAIEHLKQAPRDPIAANEIGGELAKKVSRFYALPPDMDITEAYIIHAAANMIDPNATLLFGKKGVQLLGITPAIDELPLRKLRANIERMQTCFVQAISQHRNGDYVITQTPELGVLHIANILKHLSENSPRITYYMQLPDGVVAHDKEKLPYRGIVSEADFKRLVEACHMDGTAFDLSDVEPSRARVPADLMRRLMEPLGLVGSEFSAPKTRAGDIDHIGRVRLADPHLMVGAPVMPNLFQKAVDAMEGIDPLAVGFYPAQRGGPANAALHTMTLPDGWEKAEEIIFTAALKKVAPQSQVARQQNRMATLYLGQETLPLRQLQIEIGRIQQAIKCSALHFSDGSVRFQQTPELDAYGIHLGALFTEILGAHHDVDVFMKIPAGMVVTDAEGNRHTKLIEQALLERATTNFGTPEPCDFTFSHLVIPQHVWRQHDYKLGMHDTNRGRALN